MKLKSIIFLCLATFLIAGVTELRFLQDTDGIKMSTFLNGEEVIKEGTWQVKEKSICIRGGTPANSVLLENLNVDNDGDQCLPLTCVENVYYRIRTSLQEIKFVCNSDGKSGIKDMLRANFIFRLPRVDKNKILDVVNKLKTNRGSDRIAFQTARKIVEGNVNNFNELTVSWNNRNAKREDLDASLIELQAKLKTKRDAKKALEVIINKLQEDCRLKQLAVNAMNKKIYSVNREIENLDIKHTENSDEIIGLNEFSKDKAEAIVETKERIKMAEKLYNESLNLMKILCPKSAHNISLVEKMYKDRKPDELCKAADMITSIEPNN